MTLATILVVCIKSLHIADNQPAWASCNLQESALLWRRNGHDGVSNHQLHDCLSVHSDADQRKHQSSASLAFVRVTHRGPVNFPHKWPVTRKTFPFDDVIMAVITVRDFATCNVWRLNITIRFDMVFHATKYYRTHHIFRAYVFVW